MFHLTHPKLGVVCPRILAGPAYERPGPAQWGRVFGGLASNTRNETPPRLLQGARPHSPDNRFILENLSCPMVIMRFHLVYSGPLPASGNKPRPEYAQAIRDKFHPQLELLWKTHAALRRLKFHAHVPSNPNEGLWVPGMDSPFAADWNPDEVPVPDGFINLCSPIVKGTKAYIPLVRKSLDLNCSLEILFLRQEDPGSLILQGGDVDNRIKTLFDALRMPDEDVEIKYPQAQNPTYCLLESDTLISAFDVSTDRLLFSQTAHPNEVHLVI